MADRNSGTLWQSNSGERLFEADASVVATGWVLIAQESWESVVAPAHMDGYAAVVLGLLVALFVIMIYWLGIRRISIPIQLLSEQTARLSRGDTLEEFQKTVIQEIDGLKRAFDKLNRQITEYRVGLRRY